MRIKTKSTLLRSLVALLFVFVTVFPLIACNNGGETETTTAKNEPNDTEAPATPTEKPNDTTEKPDNTTEKPNDATDVPNDATDVPNDATDVPNDGTDAPDDGTENPGDSTDTPELPDEISAFSGMADVSWFDASNIKTEYHLTSADQLAGLAQLVNEGNKFDGITVYLDCNVVWNEGTFTMAENGDPLYNGAAPANVYEWIPIGNSATPNNNYTEANGFDKQFHGNLDGQGHYISGLYTNDRERMSGLFTVFYGNFIKNLSIVNSYIGADSRTGSFFGGCYITDDWGTAKKNAGVTLENLYSDAYIVADFKGNSRSGGIGGMIRPLSNTPAATAGCIAELNNCWFDGVVYSVEDAQYNGGLIGVAAYGDSNKLGSKIVFNNCLVTAELYGNGGNVGLVLGNMYVGIAEFNNVIAIIEDTNISSANSSGIVSTLEGNNSAKVTLNYNNVFYIPAGTLSGTSYYYNKTVKGTTGIINGEPVLDTYLSFASTAIGNGDVFSFYGDQVILKGFGKTLSEYSDGLAFNELADGTYEVSLQKVTASSSTIVIPATYNGKAVTKIADGAFESKSRIKAIYVPTSVKEIGAGAMKNCSKLEKIFYGGDSATWNKITAASDWSEKSYKINIVCTDKAFSSIKVNGVPLSEYTIVIPEKFLGSDYRVAIYLKRQLDNLYGTNIEIQTDAVNYGYEFLIGSTKRTTATAPTGHSYNVNFKDGDIQIQAGSVYAYDALNDYVLGTLVQKSDSQLLGCETGYTYNEDITSKLKNGQEYTTKRDGDMRIMFFNVWGNSTTNYGPRDQHQMLAAEIINAYKPDVAGFQEFNNHNRDDGWWSLDTLLEAYGYVEVDVSSYKNEVSGKYVTNDGTRATNNFTPIFYNPEKVTVVEAKYRSYDTKYNDYGSKSLTWAVFTDKASGNQFAVLSTHFWYARNAKGIAAREENARIVKEEAAAIVAKYPGIPVFAGGDLNCETDESEYKILVEADGFTSVQATAPRTENHKTYHTGFKSQYDKMFVAGNKNVGIDINKNKEENDYQWMADGYIGAWIKWDDHPGGTYEAETGTVGDGNDGAIDHALIYNATASAVELKMFDIIASRMALLASDHCPIIFDFNFK